MHKVKFLLIVALLLVTACAPVFREDIMKNAALNPSLTELNADPESYEGKLYVLGGRIVNTRVIKEGSLIEAIYVPVDSRGYPEDYIKSIRFLALYPKEGGILDPLIFKKDRNITIAAIYKGTRTERFGETEYPFSYFEITDFRLWEEPYPEYYPYPYWWYDPWYNPWYNPWYDPWYDPWYPHHRWR
ncbi:MAG TPA: Slp family lipoprotein [Dissulfurispiraceae bacterium]|nr:Slp family lipoprotein [Dissulfurispiraceae bacterium]